MNWAQEAGLLLWEKLMYLMGGSVLGALVALLVVAWIVKNWWTRK